MSNTFTGKVSGRMSSRGWAIALGIGAVVLAAILLVVYLDRYRARVGGENAPTPVLVAKQLIPTGTPGSIVASELDVRADDAPAEGSRGRCGLRSVVSGGPRGRGGHLPRPADHRHRLRSERHGVRRLADHGHAARDLDLDRQRPRSRSRRCRSATRSTSTSSVGGVVKLFRAEREGPHDSGHPRPERRLEPRAPHRDAATRRSGPTRPTTRSSSSSSGLCRREADQAVDRECGYGAEVERN